MEQFLLTCARYNEMHQSDLDSLILRDELKNAAIILVTLNSEMKSIIDKLNKVNGKNKDLAIKNKALQKAIASLIDQHKEFNLTSNVCKIQNNISFNLFENIKAESFKVSN